MEVEGADLSTVMNCCMSQCNYDASDVHMNCTCTVPAGVYELQCIYKIRGAHTLMIVHTVWLLQCIVSCPAL